MTGSTPPPSATLGPPLDEPGITLNRVIATREDLYDSLLREEKELYPRGQRAEYVTYAMILAWFKDRER